MKISEQQVYLLLETLSDSLRVREKYFTHTTESRQSLYLQILDQQDAQLMDVGSLADSMDEGGQDG